MVDPQAWPDYCLANSIHTMLLALPPAEVRRLFDLVEAESARRKLIYEEPTGQLRTVPLMIRPRLVSPRQLDYFHRVGRLMNQALARLARLYSALPAVRALFDFDAAEREWLDQSLGACLDSPDAMVIRWDANTSFSGRHWRNTFHFFEANGVGIGGLHYGTMAEQIIGSVVVPRLQALDPTLQIAPADDPRDLLHRQLVRHAARHGVVRPRVAFVVDCRSLGGPAEIDYLIEDFHRRGTEARKLDGRDLRLEGGAVVGPDGWPIDLIYRDTTLGEFTAYERQGDRLDAIRWAFAADRVVSSLAGELDQKACMELFSNPEFAAHFPPEQRQVFRRHVLWTRVLTDRQTTGPDGRAVDLIPYVAANREGLVIKPNKAWGGTEVQIGRFMKPHDWDAVLQRAAAAPAKYVVQKRAVVSRRKFPIAHDDGTIQEVGLYVVCGFYCTADGISLIGRASAGRVVNVARHGGMTALLVCTNMEPRPRRRLANASETAADFPAAGAPGPGAAR